MKKTYQNPTMKIVKVKTTQMIATSPKAQMYGKDATSEGMSRRGRSWDDEEDDFEE